MVHEGKRSQYSSGWATSQGIFNLKNKLSWEKGSRPLHSTVKHPPGIFLGKRVKTTVYFQDDLGPSALDVALQFVSESDTQMTVDVQPVSSTSRRNLLAPPRPVAAPGYNFVWRNFRGIEEKPFLGNMGPSREANAANSSTEHFNLFIDQNGN